MDRSILNQSFSVEDIRKLRINNHECRMSMTSEELAEDIRRGAKEGHRILTEIML